MESLVHFRMLLYTIPNLIEGSLDYELSHIMKENCDVFSFIDLSLIDEWG